MDIRNTAPRGTEGTVRKTWERLRIVFIEEKEANAAWKLLAAPGGRKWWSTLKGDGDGSAACA